MDIKDVVMSVKEVGQPVDELCPLRTYVDRLIIATKWKQSRRSVTGHFDRSRSN